MKYHIYQASRQGGRKYNEDAIGYTYSQGSMVMVVADGMGGHARGEVASQLAVKKVLEIFKDWAQPLLHDVDNFLLTSIYAAHEAINIYADLHNIEESPHTTCVVCVIQQGQVWWAHVGDSRLYRFNSAGFMLHTRDHSAIQQLVDSGELTEEAAQTHPDRNTLYNSVGGYALPEIDLSGGSRLQEGEVFLLCTDGFWAHLGAREMHAELQRSPLKVAVNQLMDLAEQRASGNGDNLSVMAFRFGPEPDGS